MKSKILLFSGLFFTGMCLLTGCPLDPDPEPEVEIPVVAIQIPPEITPSSFSLQVAITDDGGGDISERGIYYKNSPDTSIQGEKVINETADTTFTCTVTGLVSMTKYYVRGYATNSAGTSYTVQYTLITSFEEISDYEGNVYQTVKIGDQVWMQENLKSTKYPDGTAIQEGMLPGGCTEAFVEIYGRYYTWDAIMNGETSSNDNPGSVQGICPDGYHIPSDAEWMKLELFLGMNPDEVILPTRISGEEYIYAYRGDIAGPLKVNIMWLPNPLMGTNSLGFSAIPTGWVNPDGSCDFNSFWGAFWTSTEDTLFVTRAWDRLLTADFNGIWRCNDVKTYAVSVRCVKD